MDNPRRTLFFTNRDYHWYRLDDGLWVRRQNHMETSSQIPLHYRERRIAGEYYALDGINYPIYEFLFYDEPVEYKAKCKRILNIIRQKIKDLKEEMNESDSLFSTDELNSFYNCWTANRLYYQSKTGTFTA